MTPMPELMASVCRRPVALRLTADLWAKVFSYLESDLQGLPDPNEACALVGNTVPISASSLAVFFGLRQVIRSI